MSRIIKFRVWANADEGMKMVYLDIMECDNGLWFSSKEHIDEYGGEHGAPVMQFTGLHDKNKKEIYEGDIVATEINLRGNKSMWTVVFHQGQFRIKNDFGNYKPYLPSIGFWKQIEVIGNIWESRIAQQRTNR